MLPREASQDCPTSPHECLLSQRCAIHVQTFQATFQLRAVPILPILWNSSRKIIQRRGPIMSPKLCLRQPYSLRLGRPSIRGCLDDMASYGISQPNDCPLWTSGGYDTSSVWTLDCTGRRGSRRVYEASPSLHMVLSHIFVSMVSLIFTTCQTQLKLNLFIVWAQEKWRVITNLFYLFTTWIILVIFWLCIFTLTLAYANNPQYDIYLLPVYIT